MKFKPSLRDCTEWLLVMRALMRLTGWVLPPQPFFLCAFSFKRHCDCSSRCITFDTYHKLAS